ALHKFSFESLSNFLGSVQQKLGMFFRISLLFRQFLALRALLRKKQKTTQSRKKSKLRGFHLV
ncbi:hypothetical protein, partial [uncultured Ruminococcus sp.]|uniref:hypothetical protein n=1 Tax=uncultured Ruminococcus sp. TaxID=165186 RepID=UPI0028063757